MADNEHTPALQGEIRWHNFNYPPLLKVMHFVPAEIPQHKKLFVMALLVAQVSILGSTILNLLVGFIQGGLRGFYAILLLLFLNPVLLLVFEKGLTGLCKDSSNLKWFLIAQPVVIVLELLVSILNIFGFNGFVQVGALFQDSRPFVGILAIIVSLGFLLMALLSGFVFVQILRKRRQLTSDL